MTDNEHRKTIKREVIATIVDTMDDAVTQGLEPIEYAKQTFLEVPEGVIFEAFGHWQCRDIDRWWDKVERTVDVEVIRRAIGGRA